MCPLYAHEREGCERTARQTVAVVVPLSLRPVLRPDEEISLRHLTTHLGRYDKFFAAPPDGTFGRDGFATKQFPRKFFGSLAAHNHLLFWPPFYRAFDAYEYLLIYHLDSLVFSDQLMQWCRADLDYIGPPWLPGPDTPWVTEARVGNGGFTLLRVQSILRVLRTRYRHEPLAYASDLIMRNRGRLAPVYRLLEAVNRAAPRAPLVGRALAHRDRGDNPGAQGFNSDYFLSFHAAEYVSGFRIGSVEQGLRFAFEGSPRACFRMNGGKLPFGCHAWTRYDRPFWEPFLLPEDTPLCRQR